METVYITHVNDYNHYAREHYEKACNAWKMGETFPHFGILAFSKDHGYVRYRVNEQGAILSAKWSKTKKALYA